MPDLNELSQQLLDARTKSDEATRIHLQEEQRQRSLRQEASAFERRFDPDRQGDEDRRDELVAKVAASEQRAAELREGRRAAVDQLARITALLEPVTDPRTAITALDARFPILLFPVRLETRFFTTRTVAGAEQKQLLVRVYPDECQVDGFEPELSDGEVKNLRRYWCATWSAGGDEGLQRSAWRELCAAHGAGRAMYLSQKYLPLPGSDAVPARGSGSQVILAVALDAPIATPNEKNRIATYWEAVWRAGSNAVASAAAFGILRGALGNVRANEVRENLVPFNIKERPQPGVDRATALVSVVFMVLPPAATAAKKRVAWTRAPQAALLPERFVLFGDSGPEHVEILGGMITQPLPVGPDPLATATEQFSSTGGDIVVPPQLKWLTDFNSALEAGMAFRIDNLTPRQATQGFDRLYVLGVRLTADEERGRQDLQALIQDQARSQSGWAIVSQGTPTNNSEQGSSGWSRAQEADELFDVARLAQAGQKQFDDTATSPYAKRDGLVLAEVLGIDAAVLQHIPNADETDQAEARAMNAALWPATLGYWMDTQMSPVFDATAIERTRRYFMDRVSGRGVVPAIRIGKQPYGILPTIAFSRMNWFDADVLRDVDDRIAGHRSFLRTLRKILFDLGVNYWDDMVNYVSRVGKPSDFPQQQLLDLLGLHPSSVEFHLNVLDSADRIWNTHKFVANKSRDDLKAAMTAEIAAGIAVLRTFGYEGADPEIVAKFFSYVHGPMDTPPIDTPPLSETDELSICTDDNKNYIGWCKAKASTAFDDLRIQKGFSAGKTPNALLYHMLRHALLLGYYKAAVDLHEINGMLTPAERLIAYREPPFVHVAAPKVGQISESRYRYLYAREDVITGGQGMTVAEFIPEWVTAAGSDSTLADQIEALAVLEHADTASLERAFAEHIDLCSYRWDAWMLSLVNERLFQLRRPNGPAAVRRLGIHLGAFGWLEDLKPDSTPLPLASLSDDLRAVFLKQGDAPLQRDPANGGHVLAPSLNHAVTAAVLRSGYLGNAAPAAPDVFAIDLSSSRVRVALQFIEGIRNGQPLGALLGYQFERRMHDRHAEAEMDALIYEIRRAFPLASKRITDSVPPEAEEAPIEQVEARNVCDGVLLLEHVRTNPVKTYPWGKELEAATSDQQTIIDQEVKSLFEIHDAIADVAVSEAVHQVMTGNMERGAAAMDAFSKGGFPTEPDVVMTPRTGASLTHRVGLHLPVNAVAAGNATPRAKAEPAIDAWLGTVMPALNGVVVRVVAKNATAGSMDANIDLDLASLGLRPIDVLHLLDTGNEQAMNELDDRIVHHVVSTNGLCPDASVKIVYTLPITGKTTVFEVAPLVASLRTLLLDARPLKPSDAALPNEANASADAAVTVPVGQVNGARGSVIQLRTDASALLGVLVPLANPTATLAAVVAGIDAAIDDFIAVQFDASLCGVSLAGAGGALRARRDWFELVRGKADKVAKRRQDRLTECDLGIAVGANPANSDLMRVETLVKAEREISTAFTSPIPNTPGPLLAIVNAKRGVFMAALTAVQAVKDSADLTIAGLWALWQATFAGRPAIDLTVEDTTQEEKQLRLLLRDMEQQTKGLLAELEKRITKGDDLLADAATAGGEGLASLRLDAAKAFLGDGLRIVPRFTLSADQGDEWQNAFDGRANLVAHLSANHDFPVDDWMHGLARVRPKMHDFENVVLSTGALGTTEPVLMPVQFPFRAAEPWLAMELPAAFDMSTAGDHVLYTASYPNNTFDKTAPSFGGLLLDEWTEVLPAKTETAALAFHYDRPSHEPPQTMLLVTPATLGEKWTWDDVRVAIQETFELAKKRAVEPRDIADKPLARFLPATLMAFTTRAVSISSELRPAEVAVAALAVPHA
jgi:hypothetical protein